MQTLYYTQVAFCWLHVPSLEVSSLSRCSLNHQCTINTISTLEGRAWRQCTHTLTRSHHNEPLHFLYASHSSHSTVTKWIKVWENDDESEATSVLQSQKKQNTTMKNKMWCTSFYKKNSFISERLWDPEANDLPLSLTMKSITFIRF